MPSQDLRIQNKSYPRSKYAPFLGILQCPDNQIIMKFKANDEMKLR